MKATDGWIDGGREGLGAPRPAWIHYSHHLYKLRGTLRVMAVFGSASLSYYQAGKISEELLCMAFKDSRRNQTLIIIPLFHSVHTVCFCSGLLFHRQRLFIVCVESHHTLFSEAGGICLYPATFKQISLYVCKRWIQVSQSRRTLYYGAELPQNW